MNVGFKRGTQSALNTLKTNVKNGTATFAEGSFYLTSDSDRLYFAQSTTELVDLNQYVRTVASVSALPTTTTDPSLQAGDFYYALNDNVFCIRNSTNTGWTQINPDTYLKSTTSAVSVTDATGGATVTTSVADSQDNIATGNFSIVGGTDVTVTHSGNTITINSTAPDTNYTLGTSTDSSQGTVNLTPSSGTGTSISLKSNNTDVLTISSDNKGVVTFKPVDQTTKSVVNTFDANGGFTTTVTDTEEHSSAAITPTIKYGSDGSASQTFKSGTATLDVYTVAQADAKINSEITKKLQAADAMHFAGTVGSSSATVTALPSITTVANGTTYKVIADISTPVKALVGDMVVAFGTEDASTGLIKTGSWLVIPAGDDQNLIGEATTETVLIKDGITDDQVAAITIKDVDTNPVTVTGVVSTTANDKAHTTFTVTHKELTTKVGTKTGSTANVTQGTADRAEFTALTKLVVDDFGHVTAAETKKLTVTDTHNSVTAVNMLASGGDAEVVGGTVVVTSAVTTNDDGTVTGPMNMVSSTLAVSGTTATANGTQVGTVTVDLIWGTF